MVKLSGVLKHKQPTEAEHYLNRVQDWFNGDEEAAIYGDWNLIKKYCEHIGIEFDDYQSLLNGEPSAELLATELFSDYKKVFINSTEIKNLEKQKSFKDKTQAEKEIELKKRFLSFVQIIEQDKLFYFVMAFHNPQKVLVVKSPSDNKEQKKFLGYEWSAAKGSEGIKLSTDSNGNHTQPLYDPINRDNPEKISFLIAQNFLGKDLDLNLPGLQDLKGFVSTTRLIDMLDFSRVNFDKSISLSLKITLIIESKYDLVKLGSVCLINPSKSEIKNISSETIVSFVEMASVSEKGFILEKVDKSLSELKRGSYTYFRENDIILAKITPCMENGKCALAKGLTNQLGMGSSEFHVIRAEQNKILAEFVFNFINTKEIREIAEQNMTGSSGHRRVPESFYSDLKIPLPPKDIQEKIVAECEAIDKEVENAGWDINKSRLGIETLFSNETLTLKRLSEVATKISDNIDPQTQDGEVDYVGLENIESETGRLVGEIKTDYSTIKSTKTVFKKYDVLYGKLRPNLNKVYLAENEGICSTDILVFRFENKEMAKFYAYYFLTKQFNSEVLKGVSGQQLPRTSWNYMQTIKIPIPDLEIQKTMVAEIETLETKIAEAQKTINEAAAKKQAVLKNYL